MKDTAYRITAAALTLGFLAPMAGAKSTDKKTAWGAAAAAAGVGAVIEATKDHPVNAAVLAAGAAYSYHQYDKARQDEREGRFSRYPAGSNRDDSYDNDPYGYGGGYSNDRYDSRTGRPSYRPGARRGPYDSTDPYYRRTDARYTRNTREVTGIVASTTGGMNRELKVRLDNGQERTIDVDKDVPVRRFGNAISVHELKKGDVVRVRIERYAGSGDLKARRVDVTEQLSRYDDRYDNGYNDPYSDRYDPNRRNNDRTNDRYNDPYYDRNNPNNDSYGNSDSYGDTTRVWGTVSSIDSSAGILRINADGRRLTVYTDRADLRDEMGGLRLRDLETGDRVLVEGRRDGDRITATRVTVQ